MIKYYLLVLFAFVGLNAIAQQPQSPYVNAQISGANPICDAGTCVTLEAHLRNSKETTDYTVTSLPYSNLYPYTGGTILNVTADDVWSPVFSLPFSFCFYGNTYNSLSVGSNGVITFNPTVAGQICEWQFGTTIPNESFPIKNAIYGVYQDTDIRPTANGMTNPAIQNVNYYVTGQAPNRIFVANFNELPAYQTNVTFPDLQTSQIVLYESSNIIDIYIKKRTPNTSWQNGNGVVGIQNATGTLATVPANRNTGSWSAINEAWRFNPNGNDSVATYNWTASDGTSATGKTLTVCPNMTTTYQVAVQYVACDGTVQSATKDATVIIEAPLNLQDPVDVSTCSTEEVSTFNIDQNALILSGHNPMDFEIAYYTTLMDAENWDNNNIIDLSNFTAFDNQVIYVRVTNIVSPAGCYDIKSFTLHITTPPTPPTGASQQTFTAGETLTDLELEGTNIQWYAVAEGGEPLPITTPLVNGTTYYATQTNPVSGCESTPNFRLLQSRFPVTVTDIAMGNPEFSLSDLKVVPNPVKDFVKISSKQTITSVEIYSLLGQRVARLDVNGIDAKMNISSLANGTYLMKVNANGQVKNVKIIKQ